MNKLVETKFDDLVVIVNGEILPLKNATVQQQCYEDINDLGARIFVPNSHLTISIKCENNDLLNFCSKYLLSKSFEVIKYD